MKESAMESSEACILTITDGPSGITFERYHAGEALERRRYGNMYRLGLSVTDLRFPGQTDDSEDGHILGESDFTSEASFLID